MRHRPQPEHERAEPLDEDEQAKVVEDIEQEARRLDARARLVFAAIEALGALVFVGLFVAALLAHRPGLIPRFVLQHLADFLLMPT